MKTRTTVVGTLTLRTDGILHVVFDFESLPTKEIVAQFVAVRQELIGEETPPVLIELIHIPYVDRSIRQFLMEELTSPHCRAVVTTDSSLVTMFHTFQLVDHADVPTEFFSSVAAAVEWIEARTATGQDR